MTTVAPTTSSLFDNKQLVHIACEFVALAGISFYFSSKNRKLSSHIEELSQAVENQQQIISNLQGEINKLRQGFQGFSEEVAKKMKELQEDQILLSIRVDNGVIPVSIEKKKQVKQPPKQQVQPKPVQQSQSNSQQPLKQEQVQAFLFPASDFLSELQGGISGLFQGGNKKQETSTSTSTATVEDITDEKVNRTSTVQEQSQQDLDIEPDVEDSEVEDDENGQSLDQEIEEELAELNISKN